MARPPGSEAYVSKSAVEETWKMSGAEARNKVVMQEEC